jgi:hypothetical protein
VSWIESRPEFGPLNVAGHAPATLLCAALNKGLKGWSDRSEADA